MQSLFENGLATGRDRTVLISQTQTPGQNGSWGDGAQLSYNSITLLTTYVGMFMETPGQTVGGTQVMS